MHIDGLIDLIKMELSEYLDKPGESLYSAVSTFSKGDVYLLGTNPGGENNFSLNEDLKKLNTKTNNEYVNATWATDSNRNPNAGEDTLQIGIKELIKKATYSKIEDVCASNLIFFKTKNVEELKKKFDLSFKKAAEKCWPIHKKVLEVVQPKVIIVFGNAEINSPYSYLRKEFEQTTLETLKTGWGDYLAKSFECELNGQKTHVVGLPHLSRFGIKNEEVYSWIKNKIKS